MPPSGKPFLDTNVLVYAIGDEPRRTQRAEGLLRAGGVISVQVLNELAAVARRRLKMPWPEIADALTAIRTLCPKPAALTLETHEQALGLTSRYGFHIYDALIVAAALQAECRELYTEDLQDGQVIDGRLTIRNPFLND
jgi:predicted nucleic acid-binding protein